jgi:spore protease
MKGMEGTESREECVGRFRVSELRILQKEAAERFGKPIGCYVTVTCGRINLLGDEDRRLLVRLLSGRLLGMARRLTGKTVGPDFKVLVVGLGNAEMTADAIGPKTVGLLTATRHLRKYEKDLFCKLGCSSLSLFAPGVLGQTGIETLELLQGAVDCVKPDLILAVDALAARSCDRLASTLQISDAGIAPGSGVGNHRAPITREAMGVPVIALGVPTVVNSATLVYDALEQAGIEEIGAPLQRVLKNGKSFFVSPKDSDVVTEEASRLLSDAIGAAFTGI